MNKPKSWYGPGGSLMVDQCLPGLTNERPMEADTAAFYGTEWMIGESMSLSAARIISANLGLEFMGNIERLK